MKIRDIFKKQENPNVNIKKESLEKTIESYPKVEPISIKQDDREKSLEIYDLVISSVKEAVKSVSESKSCIGVNWKDIIMRFYQNIDNPYFLFLLLKSTFSNYLYAHSVNTCILSLKMAKKSNIRDKEIVSLGIASLLHDIGMVDVISMVDKYGQLSDNEYNEVKKHPMRFKDYINFFSIDSDIKKDILNIVATHHERINGTGYPLGLHGDKLPITSRILQAVDVYIAMTHYRKYHSPMIPHLALKSLIGLSSELFDANVVKNIINTLSLYPPASYVKLNSGEIGQVITSQENFPTRPSIKIIVDKNNKFSLDGRVVHLLNEPIIHIVEPMIVDNMDIEINNKKVLKVQEWWI